MGPIQNQKGFLIFLKVNKPMRPSAGNSPDFFDSYVLAPLAPPSCYAMETLLRRLSRLRQSACGCDIDAWISVYQINQLSCLRNAAAITQASRFCWR